MSLPQSRNETGIPGTTEVASQTWNDLQDCAVFTSRGAMFDFGSGVDGDVAIAGVVNLARDMEYNNLSLGAAAQLNLNGFLVKVRHTFTALAGAQVIIAANGALGGAATVAGLPGNIGGGGGDGTGGGGAGGLAVAPTWLWKNSPFCFTGGAAIINNGSGVGVLKPVLGGGGGGGGLNGGGAGGTGGQGGGVGWIIARIVNATLAVVANGVVGAVGVGGNAGGGGGGGGGAVVFVYQVKTALAAAITALGGAGGAGVGSGAAGAGGVNGPATPYEIQKTIGFGSSSAGVAIAHAETGFRAVSSAVVGEGGDYIDVVFAQPFTSALGAGAYDVAVTLKQSVAGAPVPSWSVKLATVNGMRIEFTAAFDGEIKWRAWQ